MKLHASIAFSHLTTRRRQTLVSLSGVVLGVAFFLAVSSLMRGSEEDFMARLIDTAPHITISDDYRSAARQPAEVAYPGGAVDVSNVKPKTEVRGIRQYKRMLAEIAAMPGVRVAPVLNGQGVVSFAGRDVAVTLQGIEPMLMLNVSTIEKDMTAGKLEDLDVNPDGIIIGRALAEKFRIDMDDNLTIVAAGGRSRTVKVIGMFSTGNQAVDERQTFLALKRVQALTGRPHVANSFVIQMADPYAARDTAARIEAGYGYKAVSWQEASEDITSLLKVRNTIMYSVVSAILIVAAFGIYNVLSTVVLEKTRDIAILKSIGFHARDIRKIFVIEGAVIGGIGSGFGCVFGLGLMKLLASVEVKPPGLSVPVNLPIYWGADQFLMAASFAMMAAMLAAWLPARKGSRLDPVETLRGAA